MLSVRVHCARHDDRSRPVSSASAESCCMLVTTIFMMQECCPARFVRSAPATIQCFNKREGALEVSFRATLPCSAAYSSVAINAFSSICCVATPFGPFLPWALEGSVSRVLQYALLLFASASHLFDSLRASAVTGQPQHTRPLTSCSQESWCTFLLSVPQKVVACECQNNGSRS